MASRSDHLTEAMRYSLFNGGKRVRPILAYASAEVITSSSLATDYVACAVEIIHAYSLIHDDLPALDNDELRRGKPACHIAYDEATAILAGDALQALAFEQLSVVPGLAAEIGLKLVGTLALACGASGMVGGQTIDLEAVNTKLTLDDLGNMHSHKTGALIRASVIMGALATGSATDEQLYHLDIYARAIGLAFQVQDDILDVVTDTATLGKRQGADEVLNKPTYVSHLGLKGAKAKTLELHRTALSALSCFDSKADYLRALSRLILDREY